MVIIKYQKMKVKHETHLPQATKHSFFAADAAAALTAPL
jgi:hypothetical protein